MVVVIGGLCIGDFYMGMFVIFVVLWFLLVLGGLFIIGGVVLVLWLVIGFCVYDLVELLL